MKLHLCGQTPYPTSDQEHTSLTLSTSKGVMKFDRSGKVSGPNWPWSTSFFVKDGVYWVSASVVVPDSVSLSDVIVNECRVVFPQRTGSLYFGAVTTVHSSRAVLVSGQPMWCYPAWISGAQYPDMVPAHMLDRMETWGEVWAPALSFPSISNGAYGAQWTGAGDMPQNVKPLSEWRMFGYVGLSAHSSVGATAFLPSTSTRVLVADGTYVEPVVQLPPSPGATVPSSNTAATAAQLASLEAKVMMCYDALRSIASGLNRVSTSEQVSRLEHRSAADARVINTGVSALGDFTVAQFARIPDKRERMTETALVSGTASILGKLIVG